MTRKEMIEAIHKLIDRAEDRKLLVIYQFIVHLLR